MLLLFSSNIADQLSCEAHVLMQLKLKTRRLVYQRPSVNLQSDEA